jgi:large subunit ribosomal protein L29
MIKQTVINEMSDAELLDNLEIEKVGLTKMNLGHQISPLDNPMKIRVARRNVARLITEISKRNKSK